LHSVSADELRAELQQLGKRRREALRVRKETSERLKVLIPLARDAGVPVTEIAHLTGLTRVGVYEFLNASS
jgi:hypothetical protein